MGVNLANDEVIDIELFRKAGHREITLSGKCEKKRLVKGDFVGTHFSTEPSIQELPAGFQGTTWPSFVLAIRGTGRYRPGMALEAEAALQIS